MINLIDMIKTAHIAGNAELVNEINNLTKENIDELDYDLLMIAAGNHEPIIVQMLIDKGVRSENALIAAIISKSTEIIDILIYSGMATESDKYFALEYGDQTTFEKLIAVENNVFTLNAES